MRVKINSLWMSLKCRKAVEVLYDKEGKVRLKAVV